ncbi:MAG: GtrA family protein [Puniceicoccales bacterium]
MLARSRLPVVFTTMKPGSLKRMFRLVLASSGSFLLNVGMTYLLVSWAQLFAPVAYAITLTTVFFVNFTSMRYYVYGDRKASAKLQRQLRRCLIVAVVSRLAEWVTFTVAVESFGVNYLVAVVAVNVVSSLAKFVLYEKWVFANPPEVSTAT